MRKQLAVAVQVFQLKIMDKTLKDYIDRTLKDLKKDEEKNKQDHYPVIPENDNTDSPKNPYGNH
jgi:hypothetical protein